MTDEESSIFLSVVDWFSKLPLGCVIWWSSDHVSQDHPYGTFFVDVNISPIEKELDLNWTFTIEAPRLDEDEVTTEGLTISKSTDLVIHTVFDEKDPMREPIYRLVKNKDDALTAEERGQINAFFKPSSSYKYVEIDAWSVGKISKALESWVVGYTGRLDIEFRWDSKAGPSPMLQEAISRAEKVATGESEVYMIAPGVEITEEAFDELINITFFGGSDV